MKKPFGFLMLLVATAFLGCDDGADDNGDTETNEAPTVTLVGEIERDGVYAVEMTDGTDTLLFECTAENGGLITKLAMNGTDMLAVDAMENGNGSTFWTAPQTDWNWPPPAFLNTDTLTPTVDTAEASITLTSAADDRLGIQVIKKFTPDLERFAVVLEYTIVNTGDETVSYAPWEISRVLPGGVTFFPTGDEVNDVDMTPLPVSDIDGISWLDHTAPMDSGDYKYSADGADGWSAHAAGDMVFVKSFNDQPASAKPPGQGEIQLYVKGGEFEEVEQIGAYQEIPVGGQISWTVRWYLRRIPEDAAAATGDQPLVDFVDDLVQ